MQMKSFFSKNEVSGERKFIKVLRELAGYAVAGTINVAVQYGTYYLLLKLDIYYVIANAIAFLVVTVNSYFLYTYFVFKPKPAANDEAESEQPKRRKKDAKRFIRLMITNLSYLIFNSLLIIFFVETVNMPEELALLACMAVLTPYGFLLTKLWVYRE